MAAFVWKGKNRYGDAVSGRAGRRIPRGGQPASCKKEQITASSISPKGRRFSIPFLKREKVKLKELAIYSRQLSVLIDAELPLIQSLNILAEQTTQQVLQDRSSPASARTSKPARA